MANCPSPPFFLGPAHHRRLPRPSANENCANSLHQNIASHRPGQGWSGPVDLWTTSVHVLKLSTNPQVRPVEIARANKKDGAPGRCKPILGGSFWLAQPGAFWLALKTSTPKRVVPICGATSARWSLFHGALHATFREQRSKLGNESKKSRMNPADSG